MKNDHTKVVNQIKKEKHCRGRADNSENIVYRKNSTHPEKTLGERRIRTFEG